MIEWRGDPTVSEDLRERIRARYPGRKQRLEAMGLVRGPCASGAGAACACDGSCYRPATEAELRAAVGDG